MMANLDKIGTIAEQMGLGDIKAGEINNMMAKMKQVMGMIADRSIASVGVPACGIMYVDIAVSARRYTFTFTSCSSIPSMKVALEADEDAVPARSIRIAR